MLELRASPWPGSCPRKCWHRSRLAEPCAGGPAPHRLQAYSVHLAAMSCVKGWLGQQTMPAATLWLRCVLLATDSAPGLQLREAWSYPLERPQSGQEGPRQPICGLGLGYKRTGTSCSSRQSPILGGLCSLCSKMAQVGHGTQNRSVCALRGSCPARRMLQPGRGRAGRRAPEVGGQGPDNRCSAGLYTLPVLAGNHSSPPTRKV